MGAVSVSTGSFECSVLRGSNSTSFTFVRSMLVEHSHLRQLVRRCLQSVYSIIERTRLLVRAPPIHPYKQYAVGDNGHKFHESKPARMASLFFLSLYKHPVLHSKREEGGIFRSGRDEHALHANEFEAIHYYADCFFGFMEIRGKFIVIVSLSPSLSLHPLVRFFVSGHILVYVEIPPPEGYTGCTRLVNRIWDPLSCLGRLNWSEYELSTIK